MKSNNLLIEELRRIHEMMGINPRVSILREAATPPIGKPKYFDLNIDGVGRHLADTQQTVTNWAKNEVKATKRAGGNLSYDDIVAKGRQLAGDNSISPSDAVFYFAKESGLDNFDSLLTKFAKEEVDRLKTKAAAIQATNVSAGAKNVTKEIQEIFDDIVPKDLSKITQTEFDNVLGFISIVRDSIGKLDPINDAALVKSLTEIVDDSEKFIKDGLETAKAREFVTVNTYNPLEGAIDIPSSATATDANTAGRTDTDTNTGGRTDTDTDSDVNVRMEDGTFRTRQELQEEFDSALVEANAFTGGDPPITKNMEFVKTTQDVYLNGKMSKEWATTQITTWINSIKKNAADGNAEALRQLERLKILAEKGNTTIDGVFGWLYKIGTFGGAFVKKDKNGKVLPLKTVAISVLCWGALIIGGGILVSKMDDWYYNSGALGATEKEACLRNITGFDKVAIDTNLSGFLDDTDMETILQFFGSNFPVEEVCEKKKISDDTFVKEFEVSENEEGSGILSYDDYQVLVKYPKCTDTIYIDRESGSISVYYKGDTKKCGTKPGYVPASGVEYNAQRDAEVTKELEKSKNPPPPTTGCAKTVADFETFIKATDPWKSRVKTDDKYEVSTNCIYTLKKGVNIFEFKLDANNNFVRNI